MVLCCAELRAQFILEGVADLRRNLQRKGLDLLVEFGKPEKVLPRLAAATAAHTVVPCGLHVAS